MANLVDLADISPIEVWPDVLARRVQGEAVTLTIVEFVPGAVVPEHRHPNEQNGLVLQGEVTFRIGNEERVLGPGGTWRILGDTPHAVVAGPAGAVVLDAFSPIREDWERFTPLDPVKPAWPPISAPQDGDPVDAR